jgi:hypothetical protein
VRNRQPDHATVFRVKSCFGRGLALVPASHLQLAAGDAFTLRRPASR